MTSPEDGRTLRDRAALWLLPAETALAAVTVSIVIGFSRVFDDWSFLAPIVTISLGTHLIVAVMRRIGWGVTASAATCAVSWTLWVTWIWFPDTIRYGLPGPATVDAARIAVSTAWEAFRELSAPVPSYTGFLVIASLAVTFSIFLADWAAFRLWSTVEALVTPATLFIFFTLLAADQHRSTSAVAFATACLAFIVVHRATRLRDDPAWIQGIPRAATAKFIRVGAALAVLAVVGAVIIGPHLPGVGTEALVDWRTTRSGGSPRMTVSPLVDIRSRLVDQSDTVLFEVDSPQKAYWRLTALDIFDGTIWSSDAGFSPVGGDIDASGPDSGPRLHQRFEITNLGALWLPAAYRPVALDTDGVRVRSNPESSTLIVDNGYENSDGFTYEVTSVLPDHTADELRVAGRPAVPASISERYAAEPPGLSGLAVQTAIDVAGDLNGRPYDQAMALQDFFRDDFTYDLSVEPGHSDNAIDDFLLRRSGYCEQFAGTFAALARSLGLPARVAVGFTWGDEDPQVPGRYVVRGKHAHAWPEVYIADVGWVAFEPTPDRGMPGAAAWTGLAPSQVAPQQGAAPTTAPSPAPATVTTQPHDAGSTHQTTSTSQVTATTSGSAGGADGSAPGPPTARGEPGNRATIIAVSVAVLAILGYAIAAVVVPTRRREHARALARGDNAARVRLAWQESAEALALFGAVRLPGETHDEYATRVAHIAPEVAGSFAALSSDTDIATFSTTGIDDDRAEAADEIRAAIVRFVHERTGRARRLAFALDPRMLFAQPDRA